VCPSAYSRTAPSFWCATGGHLEGVLLLRENVESDLHTSVPSVLGEATRNIDQRLVAAMWSAASPM
jgi:hypothetical protein